MSRLSEELAERARYVLKYRGRQAGGVVQFTDDVLQIQGDNGRTIVFLFDEQGALTVCYAEQNGLPTLDALHFSDLQGKAVRHLREIMLLDDLARGYVPPPDSILETLDDRA